MTKILIFKEVLRKMYSRYSMYILPIIKFIGTLISVIGINHFIEGGMLNNVIVSIGVSLVCCILPVNIIIVVLSLVMTLNIYSIAAEMALVTVLLYIIMYIFYFRFSSKYGYILMLTPIFFFLKIPYIMPLIVGLALTPSAVIAMSFGIVVFYMLKYAELENISTVNAVKSAGMDKASSFVRNLVSDREVVVMICAFAAAALVVYFVKRMSVNYSSSLGITFGGIAEVVVIIFGKLAFDLEGLSSIWLICVLSVLSVGIMYILQYFIIAVDYSRTEYTQFEDDDYYYYVKAVPKVKVTASSVKVKHINVKK